MRTKFPFVLMVVVAMVGIMFALSGANAALNGSPASDLESMDKFNESAKTANPNQGVEGSASSSGDGDIIGLILSGGDQGFNLAGIVMFLPNECTRLVPWLWWFCQPVGAAGEIIAFIGLVQLAIGRIWR